eukprot:CAMPEP_0170741690 /NCGR_PEP_ID=MMETSP0437-20130122/6355_1 /TAXON_ID=0 /ORGANISM="Sexangularia sp." /LENGTH=1014 /DNA_ID=CAMNT_0011080281 /DNA_START=53 /DNA_END=3097 /DNA_ORIENTATION=+
MVQKPHKAKKKDYTKTNPLLRDVDSDESESDLSDDPGMPSLPAGRRSSAKGSSFDVLEVQGEYVPGVDSESDESDESSEHLPVKVSKKERARKAAAAKAERREQKRALSAETSRDAETAAIATAVASQTAAAAWGGKADKGPAKKAQVDRRHASAAEGNAGRLAVPQFHEPDDESSDSLSFLSSDDESDVPIADSVYSDSDNDSDSGDWSGDVVVAPPDAPSAPSARAKVKPVPQGVEDAKAVEEPRNDPTKDMAPQDRIAYHCAAALAAPAKLVVTLEELAIIREDARVALAKATSGAERRKNAALWRLAVVSETELVLDLLPERGAAQDDEDGPTTISRAKREERIETSAKMKSYTAFCKLLIETMYSPLLQQGHKSEALFAGSAIVCVRSAGRLIRGRPSLPPTKDLVVAMTEVIAMVVRKKVKRVSPNASETTKRCVESLRIAAAQQLALTLREDQHLYLSKRIVKALVSLLKQLGNSASPLLMKVLDFVRLEPLPGEATLLAEASLKAARMGEKDVSKGMLNQQIRMGMQKKRLSRHLRQVEREKASILREAGEVDTRKEALRLGQFRADMLKEVYLSYARALKAGYSAQSLGVALDGIGVHAHLIDAVLAASIFERLSNLSVHPDTTPLVSAQCVYAAMCLVRSCVGALLVDTSLVAAALTHLLNRIIEAPALSFEKPIEVPPIRLGDAADDDEQAAEEENRLLDPPRANLFELLLTSLHMLLIDKKDAEADMSTTIGRALFFAKRLTVASLVLYPHAALASLVSVASLATLHRPLVRAILGRSAKSARRRGALRVGAGFNQFGKAIRKNVDTLEGGDDDADMSDEGDADSEDERELIASLTRRTSQVTGLRTPGGTIDMGIGFEDEDGLSRGLVLEDTFGLLGFELTALSQSWYQPLAEAARHFALRGTLPRGLTPPTRLTEAPGRPPLPASVQVLRRYQPIMEGLFEPAPTPPSMPHLMRMARLETLFNAASSGGRPVPDASRVQIVEKRKPTHQQQSGYKKRQRN